MKKLIYTILVSIPLSGLCQNSFTGSRNFYLKVAPTYGFIYEQRNSTGALVKGYVPGLELDFVKPTYGTRLWHHENNFPEVGLSFNFIDYANPRQLGRCFALSPFAEIPLNKKDRATRPVLRICWGVAWLTRKFDINTNPKDIAIGSNLNTFVQWKLLWHINLNDKIRLEPGFSFAHVSNGRSQVPNLGLNVVSLNLGMNFKFDDHPVNRTLKDSTPVWPTRHEILAVYVVGFNEHEPPGGMKYFTNTLSFNYYYNVRSTHKWGGGVDLCYDDQNRYHLSTSGHPAQSWMDAAQIGIKGCYAYNLGRVSFPIEMGYYVVSKPKEDGSIFHRLGMRYYFKNGLMVNFTLKSHWAVAAHFDYGVGYRFGLRKKQAHAS